MNLEYYLGLPYSVAVTPERCTDGSACYMARVVELPGCESHGDTPEQALHHLDEAKELFIASMLEDGLTPEPPRNRNSVVTVWRMTPAILASFRKPWLRFTLCSDTTPRLRR